MNMKITAVICALAYFTVISGTPCGKHKREASDESAESSGGSGGSHFPGEEQIHQITNLFSGGNHNSNENENQEHKTESSIPFLPDTFANSINQFKPHGRGKREGSEEKPSGESSQNPFTSHLPESMQKPAQEITNLFKPEQIQQISGMFQGGNKGDKEEHSS